MSVNLPQWYVSQFATVINLLLQQKGSLLRDSVDTGHYTGKQASPVDQIGAIQAQKVTNRFAPMGRVDAPVDRRWVFPTDYDLPQLIDNFDLLRLLIDPKSKYTQNAMYAMGRAADDEIISAFFSAAKTGETGATSTPFLNGLSTAGGQVVSVSQGAAAPVGLTVPKLREAKRVLMANQVDPDEPLWCVVASKQADNLLAEAQIISTDFNDKPVLVDGKVTRFLGINFKYCERLQLAVDDAAGTSTQVPVYTQSGMHLGLWNDVTTDISIRKDLQGLPWQAYAFGTFGSTRLEEKRVVKVWCR